MIHPRRQFRRSGRNLGPHRGMAGGKVGVAIIDRHLMPGADQAGGQMSAEIAKPNISIIHSAHPTMPFTSQKS